MTAVESTLVDGLRDLLQQVEALRAANAALEARGAAQEAKLAETHTELRSMRASKATLRIAAEVQFADVFKAAREIYYRCTKRGPAHREITADIYTPLGDLPLLCSTAVGQYAHKRDDAWHEQCSQFTPTSSA